jgi:hypothetical protein
LSTASASAPASSNRFNAFAFPFFAAHPTAVRPPTLSLVSSSSLFRSTNISHTRSNTTASCIMRMLLMMMSVLAQGMSNKRSMAQTFPPATASTNHWFHMDVRRAMDASASRVEASPVEAPSSSTSDEPAREGRPLGRMMGPPVTGGFPAPVGNASGDVTTTSPSSSKERAETSARRLVSQGSDAARARRSRGHRAAGATAAARAAVPAIAQRGSSERASGVRWLPRNAMGRWCHPRSQL